MSHLIGVKFLKSIWHRFTYKIYFAYPPSALHNLFYNMASSLKILSPLPCKSPISSIISSIFSLIRNPLQTFPFQFVQHRQFSSVRVRLPETKLSSNSNSKIRTIKGFGIFDTCNTRRKLQDTKG